MLLDVFTAVVSKNDDPERKGRLLLRIPALTGEYEYPEWVPPLLPYAGPLDSHARAVFIPEVGTLVQVEMAHNPDADGTNVAPGGGFPEIRWTAARPPSTLVPGVSSPGEKSHYPKIAGFYFPNPDPSTRSTGAFLNFDYHPEGQAATLAQSERVGLVLSEDVGNGASAVLDGADLVQLSAAESGGQIKLLADEVWVGGDADYLALAQKVMDQLTALRNAIAAWVPVPNDGGASLKVALAALWGTYPTWTWPSSMAASKAKGT